MHEDLTLRIEKLFKAVDLDGNGTLDHSEIVKFCGGNKQLAADLIFDLDEDQDGEIDYDEWVNYFANKLDEDGIDDFLPHLEKMERNMFDEGDYAESDMMDYDPNAKKEMSKYDKMYDDPRAKLGY